MSRRQNIRRSRRARFAARHRELVKRAREGTLRAAEDALWGPPAVVHLCPPGDAADMPCCGRSPFEAMQDRMTLDERLVTCGRTA